MSSPVRNTVVTAAVAVVCSVIVAFAVLAVPRPPMLVTVASSDTSSTIAAGVLTTGQATVSKKPDQALVSAGITSQAGTAAAAQSDLATKTNKLIARVKALGVADRDLSTSGYWVGPVYGQSGETITGYRATQQLLVKWHNVDTVGKTLDAIVQEGGATNISVSFGLADRNPAQAEARALAIADARARAQAMAAAGGVRLGQVIRISDLSTSVRPPYDYALPGAGAAVSQVPVGQMEVQVSVEVDFSLA
jgi:uncharacterized protein